MKKRISMLLAGVMASTMLAGCAGGGAPGGGAASGSGVVSGGAGAGLYPAIAKEDLKVGVIHITDPAEGAGYTYTHELGILGMQENLGLSDDQIVRKINVDDRDANKVSAALEECVEDGVQIIFATSWGYMDYAEQMAAEYPEVIFAHGSGLRSNGANFTTYFGRISKKIS